MPKLTRGKKPASPATKQRRYRRRQMATIRRMDIPPTERASPPVVFTHASIPKAITNVAMYSTTQSNTSRRNELGGRHVYIQDVILKRSQRTKFLKSLSSLVCAAMGLPAGTTIHWEDLVFPDGTQKMDVWLFRYEGVSRWHCDVAPNVPCNQRTWSISVALESTESHFEITNGSEYRENMPIWKFVDPVVVFQTHLLHRGCVADGGRRFVLVGAFHLSPAEQASAMRNKML